MSFAKHFGSVDAVKRVGQALFQRAHTAALPLIYLSRVSMEVAKQTAQHQNLLKLGSFTEAQAGIGRFFTSFQTGAWRKVTIGESVFLLSQVGTVAGFFVIGEMLGRRNVIGYAVGERYTLISLCVTVSVKHH